MKLKFFGDDELIPAIVQDDVTDKVLMLGYMNAEAYKKTKSSGKVCFYSRSKKRLWTKGETSGNFLFVKNILVDCDKDTLLIKAQPAGPTCHTGSDTCFDEENLKNQDFLKFLEAFLIQRKKEMPKGSYTTKLFKHGPAKIGKKVGEEAVELVIEAFLKNDTNFLNEAADLLYHTMVLLIDRGFTLEDVAGILKERHQ